MAGHSKWANIQHRKGAQDAKRGKLFTKLIREVTIAARLGGADPGANPRLRTAIDKALSGNLAKDTIERAVKRGVGDKDAQNIDEIRYEGYGPGGVAVIADCMTDNRNRTVSEVRHAFAKCNGNLGTDGSVSYLFSKVGELGYDAGVDEDALIDVALEVGADDVVSNEDGSVDVLTTPEAFNDVKEALQQAGLEAGQAEITMRPSTSVELGLKDAAGMVRLLGMLEEIDDVQEVYSNADISEEILAQLD